MNAHGRGVIPPAPAHGRRDRLRAARRGSDRGRRSRAGARRHRPRSRHAGHGQRGRPADLADQRRRLEPGRRSATPSTRPAASPRPARRAWPPVAPVRSRRTTSSPTTSPPVTVSRPSATRSTPRAWPSPRRRTARASTSVATSPPSTASRAATSPRSTPPPARWSRPSRRRVNGQVRAMAVDQHHRLRRRRLPERQRQGAEPPRGVQRRPTAPCSPGRRRPTDGYVWSMVMTPDQLEGHRRRVSSPPSAASPATAWARWTPSSGPCLPWAANQTIRDAGTTGAITSLTHRRHPDLRVRLSPSATGATFEGTFAADPTTGAINWLNDCHGDTYDILPVGQVLYTVSHAHNCSMIGGLPADRPVGGQHAARAGVHDLPDRATTSGPTTTAGTTTGMPASSILQWYPDLYTGTYTGQGQAAWSVTGNSNYVALGGEFPGVNSSAQQGLVRFAVRSLATNKRGPVSAPAAPAPSAIAVGAGQVRVGWQAAYDMDNATLTYKRLPLRDDGSHRHLDPGLQLLDLPEHGVP